MSGKTDLPARSVTLTGTEHDDRKLPRFSFMQRLSSVWGRKERTHTLGGGQDQWWTRASPAQPKPVIPTEIPAVFVRGLVHGYGKHVVLKRMNMTVPQNQIYGLLGPSGTGKTSLLRILLGRMAASGDGEVEVYGCEPGDPSQHPDYRVPGRVVGYMPQETALHEELTIDDTLRYHGDLHGMSKDQIKKRSEWLTDFLDLPPGDRTIAALSGGQGRRVSLAVAMLHNPDLLILDEPTVGVDPLVRARIWEHLRELVRLGTTIIVTTHYIEEAVDADTVGLMRAGRLLAEDNPRALITKYGLPTLEDTFLELCRQDEIKAAEHYESLRGSRRGKSKSGKKRGKNPFSSKDPSKQSLLGNEAPPPVSPPPKSKSSKRRPPGGSSIALGAGVKTGRDHAVWKPKYHRSWSERMGLVNWSKAWAIGRRKTVSLFKTPMSLALITFAPCFQIMLLAVVIGLDPHDLNFGVVNTDAGFDGVEFGNIFVDSVEANNGNPPTFLLKEYDTLDEATKAVERGSSWGTMFLANSFSENAFKKYRECNWTVDPNDLGASVQVSMDMTNQQVAYTILRDLSDAMQEASSRYIGTTAATPIDVVDPPVYGDSKPAFIDFIGPGFMIVVVFVFSLTLTAVVFVLERLSATLDRVYVTGAGSIEILIGHQFAYSLLLTVQTILMLLCAFYVVGITIKGNPLILLVQMELLGLGAMGLGLVISSQATSVFEAMQSTITLMFAYMLGSGIIWPIQSAPLWLQAGSVLSPLRWAADGFRAVLGRGWGLESPQIVLGLLALSGFTAFFMAWSVYTIRIKRKSKPLSTRLYEWLCCCFPASSTKSKTAGRR